METWGALSHGAMAAKTKHISLTAQRYVKEHDRIPLATGNGDPTLSHDDDDDDNNKITTIIMPSLTKLTERGRDGWR